MRLSRRQFITSVGIAAAAGAVGATPARAERSRRLKFTYFVPRDGAMTPAPKESLQRVYLMDADYNPLRIAIRIGDQPGTLLLEEPGEPYKITALDWVDGFGYVYLVADNGGPGYRPGEMPAEVLLNEQIALSRMAGVAAAGQEAERAGVALGGDYAERMEKARSLLKSSGPSEAPESRAKAHWRALNEALWAGEIVAVTRARHAIAKRGPRPDFKFGAKAFGCLSQAEPYTRAFYDIFNYCTLPFYYRGFESVKGKPAWQRTDQMVEWCRKGNITPKGHPLMWFHEAGVPPWLEDKSFENVRSLHEHRIRRIVSRYKGSIDYWDVINEAHEFANILHYTYDQLLDLTAMCCRTARKANPGCTSVVNSTMVWGEYAAPKAGQPLPDRLRRTPFQYVGDCIRQKMDFDVIGLQIYYPHRDMFEIDRMLERFGRLGKPVHITEQGIASDPSEDPKSLVKKPWGQWHEPFSQKIQADFLEQMWTIAYSKDFLTAITYWDFSDYGGHFWPHGGFLDADLKPKESYGRLKSLIDSWQGRTT